MANKIKLSNVTKAKLQPGQEENSTGKQYDKRGVIVLSNHYDISTIDVGKKI